MSEAIKAALDGVVLDETEAVMAVSLRKTGAIHISASLNNVAAMHWMLNKAVFDLNVFEHNKTPEQPEATEATEEPAD
jgi:hypothetical protein|tara:strand:+ start:633 stop:866 length:234 start_codon:yes stop_codon:yes gene_type:complete